MFNSSIKLTKIHRSLLTIWQIITVNRLEHDIHEEVRNFISLLYSTKGLQNVCNQAYWSDFELLIPTNFHPTKKPRALAATGFIEGGGSVWESNPPATPRAARSVLKTGKDTSTPSAPITR